MLTFMLPHYCPLPDPLESVANAGLASARLLSWSVLSAWNAHPSLAWLAFPHNSAGIRPPAASVPGYRSTDIHNDVWHALIHSRTMTLWIWGHEYDWGTVMQNGHSLHERWITFHSAIKDCFSLLNPSTRVEYTGILLPNFSGATQISQLKSAIWLSSPTMVPLPLNVFYWR